MACVVFVLIEDGSFSVRSDFVDDALVTGGGEHIACFVDDESPDVLVGRVEEDG
jgi:hypothetical protein